MMRTSSQILILIPTLPQIVWFFMLYCLWRVCEGDVGIPK